MKKKQGDTKPQIPTVTPLTNPGWAPKKGKKGTQGAQEGFPEAGGMSEDATSSRHVVLVYHLLQTCFL